MRKRIGIMAAATLGLAGCQLLQQPKPQESSASVLDVRAAHPVAPRFAQPEQVMPPDEPSLVTNGDPVATITPAYGPARSADRSASVTRIQQASDKSNYKVKKGDTLYRIAKAEYGDGKKWTLIASANPGLSPQSLKSGATIVIP